MTKFLEGDLVSVIGIVRQTPDSTDANIFIRISGVEPDIWVDQKLVVMDTPNLKVGDRCFFSPDAFSPDLATAEILAIKENQAWLSYIDEDGKKYCTRHLNSIGRVDSDD